MAHVVALANQKGGVGKTTTCVNIAAYLSAFGYKTLLVDFDPQANASSSLGVVDKKAQNSIYSALGGKPIEQCIRHTAFGLDLIPSSLDLAGAESELEQADSKHFVFDKLLCSIRDKYDFVLIDCAPSINLTLINALCAADGVIIPLQCEYFAIEGLNQLLNTIRLVKKHLKNALELEGIVLTMYSQRTRLSSDVEHNIRELFGKKVFNTAIPRNIRLAEAPSYMQPIMLYDSKCQGAIAYKQLTKEYIASFNLKE